MNFTDFDQNISNFVDGLSTFLIGLTIVFATLVLLIFIIKFVSKIVSQIENMGKKEVIEAAVPIQEKVEPIAVPNQDDLELIAVISAAIAASLGTTSDKLQVRSLRKVERKSL